MAGSVRRFSGSPKLVWSLQGFLSRLGCHQRSLPGSGFRADVPRYGRSPGGNGGLLAGPAALLKQVPNGYKIRLGQFIITTWIRALANPLPFIPQAVSFYLSNWCYWWRGTDPPPFTPFTSLPHSSSTGPFPSHLAGRKTLTSPAAIHAGPATFMHLCTLNSL